MTVYYVDPADTTQITKLITPYSGTLPDGRTLSGLEGPNAPGDIYAEDDQRTPPPDPYRDAVEIRTFVGTVRDPAARVVVTVDYQQIPIEELYQAKRGEISDQDNAVRYNAIDTSLSAAWWLIVTERARSELLTIATGSNSRAIAGGSWPTGPNAPWVGIFKENTGASRRYQITEAETWDTLETEWYQHDQATGNATDASRAALDAAYADGLGDWQTVADHDAADPAWGYPPTVDGADLRAAVII